MDYTLDAHMLSVLAECIAAKERTLVHALFGSRAVHDNPRFSCTPRNAFLPPSSPSRGTYFTHKVAENNLATAFVLVIGVVAFAVLFAVNSSVHSYLIVSYSNKVIGDEMNDQGYLQSLSCNR